MKKSEYELLMLLLGVFGLCVGCFAAGLGLGALL